MKRQPEARAVTSQGDITLFQSVVRGVLAFACSQSNFIRCKVNLSFYLYHKNNISCLVLERDSIKRHNIEKINSNNMNNCSDLIKGTFNWEINSLHVRMSDGNTVFYYKPNTSF